MKNPFSYYNITFKLNYYQLQTLINLLKSCNPTQEEEQLLVNIVDDLQKTKTEIEND